MQEEATDRACRSPTLLGDVIANRNAIFRSMHIFAANSKGSKGAKDNPSTQPVQCDG